MFNVDSERRNVVKEVFFKDTLCVVVSFWGEKRAAKNENILIVSEIESEICSLIDAVCFATLAFWI